MNRFSEELKVIPWTVWALAVGVTGALIVFLTVAFPVSEMPGWPGRVLFLGVMPLVLATWVLLIGYVYGDARRRGMRYIMWTLLAIFIPNAIGVVLYFIMREPAKTVCPKCGGAVPANSTYCPSCGAALVELCPQCGRPVEPGWSHCTQCGSRLKAA
jgi:hypothetical protein